MTENIVTGKKYRILTNATSDIWDRISFWTRASDVAFNDNSTLEASKGTLGHTMLKRSTAYTVGNIAYTDSAPSWVMLRCTTAGTTAASAPSTYGTISSVGTVITDGTAKFTVYDARPNATLSSSAYQIPTMSLVNNLNSELTANGKQFYFDYKNGKYGYNTSSNRAASTFVPFGGSTSQNVIGGRLGNEAWPVSVPNIVTANKNYVVTVSSLDGTYWLLQSGLTVSKTYTVTSEYGSGYHDITVNVYFGKATGTSLTFTKNSNYDIHSGSFTVMEL
jgi:hypothetical protein